VEEPVHHHEKDDDRQEAGRRLHLQRGQTLGQRIDDADCTEPGDEGGAKGEAEARGDWLLVGAPATHHVGRQGGDHEDALQPFPEDQHGNIEHPGAEIHVDERVR